MSTLLPPNATQLELNIERSIAEHLDMPVVLKNNRNADLVEVALLPFLAQDFSVDFWENSWSEFKKRQAINASVELHQLKGTKFAVKTTIEKVTQDYQILEWFETGGSGVANTMQVDLTAQASVDIVKEVSRGIENSKPLHVHVAIIIHESAIAEMLLVAAGYAETHQHIYGVAA